MILPGVCGFPKAQAQLFRELPLAEIQETFDRPVPVRRAKAWRDRAPDEFVFTVKASQFITHDASSPTYSRSGLSPEDLSPNRYGSFRNSEEVWGGWVSTKAVAEALRSPAILFQTPASFGPRPEYLRNLYAFFETVRGGRALLVWEPRGPWPSHVIEKICADLGLVHAVDPFATESVTIGVAYMRLHGSPPGTTTDQYTYSEEDLRRVRDLASEYDDAYVLFNNKTMFDDAIRFQGLLGSPREGTGAPRPPQ